MIIMKKKIAVLCSLSLLAGTFSSVSVDVNAASIKLNKKTATIKVGKKVTLKVKGTKKKVKWSSSKKSVASVSGKGVVKGKKAGKATITAKVGKKKLKCNVTVEKVNTTSGKAATNTNINVSATPTPTPTPVSTPVPTIVPPANDESKNNVESLSADELAANVDVAIEKIASGILLNVTNRNTVWLEYATINYNLKDSSGTVLKNGTSYIERLKPGATIKVAESLGLEEDEIQNIDVNKSVVSKTVTYNDTYQYADQSNKVSLTSSVTKDGDISYEVKNNSGTIVDTNLTIFFYDSNKKIVDAKSTSLFLQAGATEFDTFKIPDTLINEGYVEDDDGNFEWKTSYKYTSYEIVAYSNSRSE